MEDGAGASFGVALDARSLDALKAKAGSDPRGAALAAARKFEAIFLQQILAEMRKSLPDGDPFSSDATRMQTSLLDQQLAEKMAERGTGLAEAIARSLEKYLPAPAASGQKTRPAAGPAATMGTPAPAKAQGTQVGKTVAHGMPTPAGSAQAIARMKESFVKRVSAHAQEAASILGVPTSYIVGQAALESGWGRHEITGGDGRKSFNLFGIKAGSHWKGATVEAKTTEVIDGVARQVVQRFRAYSSYAEAFADYAKMLATSRRYAGRVVGAPDARSFAQGLKDGGYATDPRYAAKLASIIGTTTQIASTLDGAPNA